MSQIIDRTKEFYPELEGAEYLEFKSEAIPKGVRITKGNVAIGAGGVLKISRFAPTWRWDCETRGCQIDFTSPEAALDNYIQLTKR